MYNKMNLYEARKLFKLPVNYTFEELKSSYRKLIIKWHPDKFATSSQEQQDIAEKMTKQINEANEILIEELNSHSLTQNEKIESEDALKIIKNILNKYKNIILNKYLDIRKQALFDFYFDNFTLFDKLESFTKKDLKAELYFLYCQLPDNSNFITKILLTGSIEEAIKFYEQNILEDYLQNIFKKQEIRHYANIFIKELDKYTKKYYNQNYKSKHWYEFITLANKWLHLFLQYAIILTRKGD